MAARAKLQFNTSIRVVCNVFGISETCYRYQAKLSSENALIADWLLQLTTTYKRWGFGLCYFLPAQHKRLQMEPQACLSDIPVNWS